MENHRRLKFKRSADQGGGTALTREPLSLPETQAGLSLLWGEEE